MQKTETTKFRLSYNVKSAVISSEVEKSYEISPCASLSRDDKYFSLPYAVFWRFYYENLTCELRKNCCIVMPQILLPDVFFQRRFKSTIFWLK